MQLLYSLLSMLNSMSPYILLGFLIAGMMHAFVPQSFFTKYLSGTGWKPVVTAALIGIPLPLCSCGVLPTAIAMRRSGASKGAATSFLVATPQTGADSIAATWSLLGLPFAILRPVAALVTSFFAGIAIDKGNRTNSNVQPEQKAGAAKSFRAKIIDTLHYGFVELAGSIGGWLIAGLVIAAIITVYVPDGFFTIFENNTLLSMLAVLVIAVPMYVCATGSIPIAMSLVLKGLSPGTAFVLLMAGPAVNFASIALISREWGRRATIIYLGAIIIGALSFGLMIDYVLPTRWFTLSKAHMACDHNDLVNIFSLICSGILVISLIYSMMFHKGHHHHKQTDNNTMTKEFTIKGMNCNHCRSAVEKAIAETEGVTGVEVDLHSGKAIVTGDVDDNAIREAVERAGFNVG